MTGHWNYAHGSASKVFWGQKVILANRFYSFSLRLALLGALGVGISKHEIQSGVIQVWFVALLWRWGHCMGEWTIVRYE